MVSVGPQHIIKQHLWSVGASTRHDQKTSCGVRWRKKCAESSCGVRASVHGSESNRGDTCCLRVWKGIITGVLCKVGSTFWKRQRPLTSMCLYPLLHWLSYESNSYKHDWLNVLLLVDDVCLVNCVVLNSIATFTFLYIGGSMSGTTRMCLPPASILIVLKSGRPDRIDFMFGLAAGSCLINCVFCSRAWT